ncbi:MAG TPA: OmpH family outer membrane protein [Segetibacter sp.]|jgi:Skp family chaperone for outer membrane proteins
MKKVLLVVLAFAGTFFAANNANAQGPRVGVFDVDIMVRAMPGYRAVDSLLQRYEQDSLRGEYEFAVKEYNRLDSTYKKDSAAGKAATVLNYQKDQRSQIATTIIYWQQISQQKSEQKRQELAGPMYEKILSAYQKVLTANNYLVVLKPGAYELGSKVENVFEKVAKELKITLPDELRSQGPAPEQTQSAPAPSNRPAGAAKPAAKKQ